MTVVKGWLAKWLQCQPLRTRSMTALDVEVLPKPKHTKHLDLLALIVGLVAMLVLLAFTIFIGDCMDLQTQSAWGYQWPCGGSSSRIFATTSIKRPQSIQSPHGTQLVKVFIVRPDGTLISIRAPEAW